MPFQNTATKLYIDIGTHQYNNKLAQWCNGILDSKQSNYAEFSLTGKKRVLITREPEQIKAILATKFANFGHGPQWHRLWRPFLGKGIFATDGDDWHRSRGLIRPMFVKDRLRNLVIFDNCTRKLLSRLPPSGTTVDIKDVFYRWTLDTTTEFLLGENTNSLDKKLEEFIEPIIQRAISLPQHELEELSKIDTQYTFLHSIARVTKDPKIIRDEIMSVLLAGRDTTAATLSWVMYEMAYVPETWAKLREEILNELGPHGMPTYETLKNIQYLKNVLNEVLRLHPAVPINMRQALEDTVIPGAPGQPDVALLKGDTVTINTIGMHARKDLYPPISKHFADPAIFSPERWEHWIPTPWTYTPFSGGPRICVGQNFALTEMAFCCESI
ncbi:Cytochrome P450 52A3-B [Metarhizium anisopliae]|nr:Cytochrome P450 52A3-B [Metarhizium anisopliae]